MDYVPYPGRLDGAADLLDRADRERADYLVAGLIEHRFYRSTDFLDGLDRYPGVRKVFRDAGNTVYRLDRAPAGDDFGVRPKTERLYADWRSALAAGDTMAIGRVGPELAAILAEDGRWSEARTVALDELRFARPEDELATRLDLAFICLKMEDTATGIAALDGHLEEDDMCDEALEVAKGAALLGQLYRLAADDGNARTWLRRSWEMYRDLGLEKEAEPLRKVLEELKGKG
jgi:hypothetical protein